MNKILALVLLPGALLLAACQPPSAARPSVTPGPTTSIPVVDPTASPTAAVPTGQPAATDTPAVDSSAALSIGRIAFYSDRDGDPEIYTMSAGSSQPTRLTNDPAFDDSPALSPDGRHIAFLSARHDPDPVFPNFRYELYLVDVDGQNLTRLTETEAAEGHPAWSPQGDRLLFDADYDGDGRAEIYMLALDGLAVTRLTDNPANDQFADWSPDGEQIAFASDRRGGWDIFLMNADGSDQRPLTSGPDWELFPAWSPDGRQIAYTALAPGSRNTDIFVMQTDGSQVRQLTDEPGFDENPAWSPDGSQIIFQTRRGGSFDLYVMDADGGQLQPLVSDASDELWPSWAAAAAPPIPEPLLVLEKSSQELGLRETFQAALGDLDGDGDLDALFANPMRNPAQVWLNDGQGYFTDSGQRLTEFGHGAALGDFDADGDLDAFLVCHQNVLPSKLYFNDGRGQFSDSGLDFGDGRHSAVDVQLLDLNGDGFLDVHVVYYSGRGAPDKVYLNDGSGSFTDSGLALPEDFIAWGDLDGDGDVDYFAKTWGTGYSAMLNEGRGSFAAGWQLADQRVTVGDVILADFDADGDLDALIANGFQDTGSQPARLLWNDGQGHFSDSAITLSETMAAHFAAGDLDLDGDLDVFVTQMDRPNEVWLYDAGNFLDSGLRLGSAEEMSGRPTLGDLDGDGDLDVIVGRFRGGAQVWFNH